MSNVVDTEDHHAEPELSEALSLLAVGSGRNAAQLHLNCNLISKLMPGGMLTW